MDAVSQLEHQWPVLAAGPLAHAFAGWRESQPTLRRFGGPTDLLRFLGEARGEESDSPLHALLTVAAVDPLAGRLCLQAILPALNGGKWVVCDRFADSTRVYQGSLGQVDQRLIKGLERVSIGDLAPDLTLVLDVPVELGLERVKLRRGEAKADRFEAEDVEFHQKLREAYLAIAAQEPERCVVVDAGGPKEAVARKIWNAVGARLDPMTFPVHGERRRNEVGAS